MPTNSTRVGRSRRSTPGTGKPATWGRAAVGQQRREPVMAEDAPMNIGAALELPFAARQKVLRMQTKLHCWAAADRGRRFDDLFNLVADPCFLAVAWTRVRENTGARSAGIDKRTVRYIENRPAGVVGFLEELREAL